MHKSFQDRIMASINKTQVARRNSPFDSKTWQDLPDFAKHGLLEEDAAFDVCLSLVYTRMMERVERYRNVESRRYAENIVAEQFGRFSTSGVKYELSENKKFGIKNTLLKIWKQPL